MKGSPCLPLDVAATELLLEQPPKPAPHTWSEIGAEPAKTTLEFAEVRAFGGRDVRRRGVQ